MGLRFEDERYVRVYSRDTPNWVLAPWQARAVLPLVMRKLDRAGTIDLSDDGMTGLAALVSMPLEVVETGMAWWVARATFELHGGVLVMPRFLDGQETAASDKLRAQAHRERARDIARSPVTLRDASTTKRDATITNRDGSSREQTRGHASSHDVTLCLAVPGRDEPSEPSRAEPRQAEGESLSLALEAPAPTVRGERRKATRASTGNATPTADRVAKGSRLPEGWRPSLATVAMFRKDHRVDALAALERFADYWKAAAGAKGLKADWEAAFRNWVRKDIDDGRSTAIDATDEDDRILPDDDELLDGELATDAQKADYRGRLVALAEVRS
jgi:hypothetical protein